MYGSKSFVYYNILLITLSILNQSVLAIYKLQEQFSWSILNYAFPDETFRNLAILNGEFIPMNNLPVGIEVWNNKLFISVPRWKAGVPSTLNYVPLYEGAEKSPKLIPYPDWKSNELGNCDEGLSTVYRIKVDSCDRLWVLDTGTFGIEETTVNLCPYAINIYDLKTNNRIRRYVLESDLIKNETFIANLVLEMGQSCDDTYAYMSDELAYGLIVYSFKENRSWRFEHPFFRPDPLKTNFFIGGLNFQWDTEGIFAMSVVPDRKQFRLYGEQFNTLLFSPLASFREFGVSTRVLHDEQKARTGDFYYDFTDLGERGNWTHTTSRVFMQNNHISSYSTELHFLTLIDRNAIGCMRRHSNGQTQVEIVDRDVSGLIFPSDIKIDRNRNLWVISDRMPNFLLSNLDYNDINFRVYFAPADVLLEGTNCLPQSNYYYL